MSKIKPWKNVCTSQCWFAHEKRCICRCHGTHHGEGTIRKLQEDPVLTLEQSKPFISQIKNFNCCWCGESLLNESISYYTPHLGGWIVKGLREKAWLYIVCPKCGYQWALWKLGVNREIEVF